MRVHRAAIHLASSYLVCQQMHTGLGTGQLARDRLGCSFLVCSEGAFCSYALGEWSDQPPCKSKQHRKSRCQGRKLSATMTRCLTGGSVCSDNSASTDVDQPADLERRSCARSVCAAFSKFDGQQPCRHNSSSSCSCKKSGLRSISARSESTTANNSRFPSITSTTATFHITHSNAAKTNKCPSRPCVPPFEPSRLRAKGDQVRNLWHLIWDSRAVIRESKLLLLFPPCPSYA